MEVGTVTKPIPASEAQEGVRKVPEGWGAGPGADIRGQEGS